MIQTSILTQIPIINFIIDILYINIGIYYLYYIIYIYIFQIIIVMHKK